MALKEDVIAYPMLPGLVGAIGTEFDKAGIESPAFLGVWPGQLVSYDHCGDGECGGQTWVRAASVFPASNFPNPDTDVNRWGTMAVLVEVGTVRCAPQPEHADEFPTAEQYLDCAREALADMAAMRRAICNYLTSIDRDFILGSYTPVGPDGGCVGGIWTVTVRWH